MVEVGGGDGGDSSSRLVKKIKKKVNVVNTCFTDGFVESLLMFSIYCSFAQMFRLLLICITVYTFAIYTSFTFYRLHRFTSITVFTSVYAFHACFKFCTCYSICIWHSCACVLHSFGILTSANLV